MLCQNRSRLSGRESNQNVVTAGVLLRVYVLLSRQAAVPRPPSWLPTELKCSFLPYRCLELFFHVGHQPASGSLIRARWSSSHSDLFQFKVIVR
eukprot:s714_g11.t1